LKLLFGSLVILFQNFLFISGANAQVFGQSARTEFFGGFGIRVFYSRINKTQFLINSNMSGNSGNPNIFINVMNFTVVYGALPKLSLIGVFPNIARTVERTVDNEQLSDTDFGLGDLILFAKYRFFKKNRHLGSSQIAVQAGLKLPTGADKLTDTQSNALPQPLQLGSGSVDYWFVLSFTEVHTRFFFSGDFAYKLKTEANHFKFGHVFSYDFAIKYRLFPSKYTDKYPAHDFFVFLEVNGIESQESKMNGRKIMNSGGYQVFIAPGFQFFPFDNIIFEAGLQLPVLEDLNGVQLGTDFHFRSGLRWII
jgi:hypothetical protein